MTPQSATAMQPVRSSVPVRQGTIDLMGQFDKIYDSISRRAFELFNGNGKWAGHELDNWLHAESELLHPLHLEITESDGEFTVVAEVPGFTAKDLEIKVEPHLLSIAGNREIKEERNGRKIRSECCSDMILRAVNLPAEVDASKATATVRDGILLINLPKTAHTRAVRIEPKSA